MLIAIVLLLVLKRKWAIAPLLLIAIFVPFGQHLYISGIHLSVLRMVVIAGCMRLVAAKFSSREGLLAGGFNSIDQVFCLWAVCRAVAFMLLYRELGAVLYQVGFLIDTLGGYFLLRYLLRDEEDIACVAKVLAFVAVVMGSSMLIERFGDVNIFGYAGSLSVIPQFRDGQIRAQGAFGHPVLAGVFASTLIPLFFWLFKSGKARIIAVAGFFGATAMIWTAASSTPVLAGIAGILGLCLWPIRNYMRVVRWGIVCTILGLAVVMKAPVWFIIAHVDVISASSGWHRAALVDTFVNHFSNWWLLGTTAADNQNWGFEMIDTSNQFVNEGVYGGLLALTLFIAMICRGFSRLGRTRKLMEERGDRQQEWFLWSLCAVLLANVFAFWGTTYWDQTNFWWFTLLASISVASLALQNAPVAANIEEVSHARLQGISWGPNPAASSGASRKVMAHREAVARRPGRDLKAL